MSKQDPIPIVLVGEPKGSHIMPKNKENMLFRRLFFCTITSLFIPNFQTMTFLVALRFRKNGSAVCSLLLLNHELLLASTT